MDHKNYLEFKRPTLVEPPSLYYMLLFIAMILIAALAVSIGAYLNFFNDESYPIVEYFIAWLPISIICVYRLSRERALIHDNGNLEIFRNYKHTITPITDITQVHFGKWHTICGNVIVIKLELKNGKMIKLLLKDNEQFLAELKKHNSNIIIPELPVV